MRSDHAFSFFIFRRKNYKKKIIEIVYSFFNLDQINFCLLLIAKFSEIEQDTMIKVLQTGTWFLVGGEGKPGN